MLFPWWKGKSISGAAVACRKTSPGAMDRTKAPGSRPLRSHRRFLVNFICVAARLQTTSLIVLAIVAVTTKDWQRNEKPREKRPSLSLDSGNKQSGDNIEARKTGENIDYRIAENSHDDNEHG